MISSKEPSCREAFELLDCLRYVIVRIIDVIINEQNIVTFGDIRVELADVLGVFMRNDRSKSASVLIFFGNLVILIEYDVQLINLRKYPRNHVTETL